MKAKMKYLAVLLAALVITAASAVTALAYEKDDKAIKSVNLHVDGYIELETKFGEEELNVTTSGNKYDYDHYEVQNFGFRWMLDDVPDIKIYLSANEGYYFRIIKASQIKLTPSGAKTTYTWNSSDPGIATVSGKGVVKGMKKGTATITVTTANGKSARVKIKVK